MGPGKWKVKIVQFIRGYFRKAGKKTAVVGVSGGLDSAVALALCVKALGRQNVMAVFLPSKNTPAQDMKDARQLAREFGTRAASFNIEPVLRACGKLGSGRLARANFSARMRMAVLYSIASRNSGLVVGTGDRSEFMLGYFTKHGDGGADMFPIAGLYKTEARELAHHLGVPHAIASKPSSPNLWKGHTAEGELGFSYETADGILKGIEKSVPKKALERKFGKKAVLSVLKRMKENAHKRLPAPVCRIQ